MKKCPYCGKIYPDDAVVCPSDQRALIVSGVAPDSPRRHSIVIRRFTVASLFKIVAIGCMTSFFSFSVLMGFLSLFGAHTVHWNRAPVTGVAGMIASVFLGCFLAVAFTIIGWIGFALGFWLFSRFSSLRLDYIADQSIEQTNETIVRT